MKKTILSLLAISALALFASGCAPTQGAADGQTPVRTLNSSGVGSVQLQPDMARVNVGVRSQAQDIQEALDENIAQAEAIRDALIEMGIEEKDIQTRNFSVFPVQGPNPVPETDTRSFAVENTVSVVVRDLDMLGDVLSGVVDAGANTIHGVQFDISDREAAIEEARTAAIQDAKAQAEAIAEAAGVTLGEIRSISINEGGGPGPVYAEMAMEAPQADTVPISGGTMTIRVTANMTFDIE
jgi:hypothetical protein